MSVAVAEILRDIAPEPERELAELWRYAPTGKLARQSFASARSSWGMVYPKQVCWKTDGDTAVLSLTAGQSAILLLNLDCSAGQCSRKIKIVVQEGATLTLLENTRAMSMVSDAKLHKLQLFANVKSGATLCHVRLATIGADDYHFSRSAVTVAADGRYDYFVCVHNGAQTRHQVEVALNGPRATAVLTGCTVLAGDQLADHTLTVRHNARDTHSQQFFRSVAADSSRSAFQGKIVVAKGADGTDARQSHKALLLGARAEIDAKPELEIHADEVKCSHGASVGKLDEAALFYLRSRGLDAEEARALLTAAFLHEALDVADWLPEAWRGMVEASLATAD